MPDIERPFTAFKFMVEIEVPGLSGAKSPLCLASFSECDGLEMTMEPKTIREGGNNGQQIHLAGPVSYGKLTLKRGMTSTLDLWRWFEAVAGGRYGLRASTVVKMLASDDTDETKVQAEFELSRCLPIKLKAPSLNGKDGLVAVEEMQIAYETLSLRQAR